MDDELTDEQLALLYRAAVKLERYADPTLNAMLREVDEADDPTMLARASLVDALIQGDGDA